MFFKATNEEATDIPPEQTLILASVSVGNVGQLTVDLFLENIKPAPVKVGRIFHPALEPVCGVDSANCSENSLVTECEVFMDKNLKLLIVQFRSFVFKRGRESFLSQLLQWAKSLNVQRIVCAGSIQAADRLDGQLRGSIFRYLSNFELDADLLNLLKRFKAETLEKRVFPAPAGHVQSSDGPIPGSIIYTPGGGIIKDLYELCVHENFPCIAIFVFASEGYSVPEAISLYELISTYYGFYKSPKIPVTWQSLIDGPSPAQIY